jgi:hypothetical protein
MILKLIVVSTSFQASKTYIKRDTATKQRIIGSIFPKKLIFEKKSVRILEVNSVACLILNPSNTSEKSKKEKHTYFGVLSFGYGLQ